MNNHEGLNKSKGFFNKISLGILYVYFLWLPIAYLDYRRIHFFDVWAINILSFIILLFVAVNLYGIFFRRVYVPDKIYLAFIFLIVYHSIISVPFMLFPVDSLKTVINVTLTQLFFLFVFNLMCHSEVKRIIRNLTIIFNIYSIGFILLQGYFYFFGPINVYGKVMSGYYKDGLFGTPSITSIFHNPNVFGLFLCVAVYLNLLNIAQKKKSFLFNKLHFLNLLYIGLITLTRSRTAFLGVVIAYGLIILCLNLNRKKLLGLITAGLVFLIIFTAGAGYSKNLFSSIDLFDKFTKTEDISRGRLGRINEALSLVNENNRWFGVGTIDKSDKYRFAAASHSDYINLIRRGGYPLLMIYLSMLTYVAFKGFRSVFRSDPRHKNLLIVSLIILFVMLLQQAVEQGMALSTGHYFFAAAYYLIINLILLLIQKANFNMKNSNNGI